MNKRTQRFLTLAILSIIAIFSFHSFTSEAEHQPQNSDLTYSTLKKHFNTSSSKDDPDGNKVSTVTPKYVSNKGSNRLKKKEQLHGYVPENELNSGKYIRSELITYQEYFDLGISTSFRHDISADRMVWLIQSKFEVDTTVSDKLFKKPVITTLYDAETGDFLDITVESKQ